MSKCCWCKNEIEKESDLYNELCEQADFWGMESLTENEQLVVEVKMCSNCCLEL